jgi:macrodomain Ter protein organizer (MatP/YcbG family)
VRFQKGNKLSPGGKTGNKGGRPSKEKLVIIAEMKRMVEEHLSKHVGAVLEVALKLATGVKRKKFHSKTGKPYYEKEYDSAMIRWWLDKFVPDAAKTLDVNINSGLEGLIQDIEEAARTDRKDGGR